VKGLKLNFDPEGASISLNEIVEGFDAVVQNALVVIGTSQGSDKMLPDKGTKLLEYGVKAMIINRISAIHAANFASIDALFFSRTYESPRETDKLASIELSVQDKDAYKLALVAKFTSISGKVKGTLTGLM
jgi:hypothetical protein